MATAISFIYRRPLMIPAVVFSACILIRFLPLFSSHTEPLSTAIALDLALTAPLLYLLAIRKTTLSRRAAFRVFIAGVFVAGLLVPATNPILAFIKSWISPVAELTVILYVARQFYTGVRKARTAGSDELDFLAHCRAILQSVFGSAGAATILSSEVAVFYYLFAGRRSVDNQRSFSTYRQSGALMVLYTFLCLFVVETAGMHLVFSMWNSTAA